MTPARAIALVLLGLAGLLTVLLWPHPETPIRIGVIHSQTGTMAAEEAPLIDAIRLAVNQTNAAGGLLGKRVEMLVADGRSDDAVFAAEAERLITEEKVSALFACWTSSCRKAVRQVVEKHRHLLMYSLQYEGLEDSPDVFFTGATANQQVIPGIQWSLGHFGKHVVVVGSDYIYPHVAGQMVKDSLDAEGGELLGEYYRPLGSDDFAAIAAEIARLKPDVVINLLNGSSNRFFFKSLLDAGVGTIPVMSFSVTEAGLQDIGHYHPEHYVTWNYLGSLDLDSSRAFIAALKGQCRQCLATDPVESSYVAFRLWAEAVKHAESTDLGQVKQALLQESVAGPAGVAAVDRTTHHLWKPVLIGKAMPDNTFSIVWHSGIALRPEPYPDYRSRYDWLKLLEQWGAETGTRDKVVAGDGP